MWITVNDEQHSLPPDWHQESLLMVLRELIGLVGAKFGCGVGLCGACSVLIDGELQRSCLIPVRSVGAKNVVTIEGIADGDKLHPIQHAWLTANVAQCGYCQAGQIMSALALLNDNSSPTDSEIDAALSGNLCRCGTQQRIRAATHLAAGTLKP